MTKPPARDGAKPYAKNAGNVFFALFAAVGMVGAVGYGFNTVIKGPISAMTDTTRRTVAESTVITSSRLAIVGATTQQTNSGDCDDDGAVEPLPYRSAGGSPAPIGGGYLPTGLLPNSIDPWNTEYGYCAWDTGSLSVSDAVVACGGATPRRLEGSPLSNQYAIAIISAGKDRTFQTRCNAYVDTTPADSKPDTPLIQKAAGSDDIVLGYTYAEANDLGNGLWKPKTADPTTATTDKNLEVKGTGGGKFTGQVALEGNTVTGGGLILPSDPGDNSITGACDALNDKQLRYNVGDGSEPPVIEICDFGGLGWSGVSGGAGAGAGGATTGNLVAHWKLNEVSGNIAKDSVGNKDGTVLNGPTWTTGKIGGALEFVTTPSNQAITVPRSSVLEPTAFTIALWVKPTGTQWGSNNKIVSYQYNSAASSSYSIHFNSTDASKINFGVRFGPSSESIITQASTNTVNQWIHVVAIYDPNGAAPQHRLYINGALDASTTVTSPIEYTKIPTDKLVLGNSGTLVHPLKGLLDDVRLYNYALSTAEVKALYQTSSPNALNLTAARKAGKIFTWGDDTNEALGNGAETSRETPGPAITTDGFIEIDGAGRYGCGIREDGTVWCWGNDGVNGRLGNGPVLTADQATPTQVLNLTNAVAISTASTHACALVANGTMWCWGNNSEGQLGDGTTTSAPQPVKVQAYNDFIDLSLADSTTCGLRYSGEVWCWGLGTTGALGNGASLSSQTPVKVSNVTDFVALHGNSASICGTTKRGTGYCWGTEANGNFGNGATSGIQNTPTQVTGLTDLVKMDFGAHGCGLRATGQISCWGLGVSGQLGNGANSTSDVPVTVSNISDFIDVTASGSFTCGVRSNGELWCWGADTYGVLGNGYADTANKPVPSKAIGDNFISLGSSAYFVAALVDTSAIKTPGAGVANITSTIGDGVDHKCFLNQSGAIMCSGDDTSGQLGNGATTGTRDTPSPFSANNYTWTSVYGAGYTNCAIRSDGSAWCWGSDSSGQLGNGATAGNQISPTAVTPNVGPWDMLSLSHSHTCGIASDGRAWCWGSDADGQLGNGATGAQIGPDAGALLSGSWKTISAGLSFTCGVKTDGTGWCWGDDSGAQLGNGSTLTADQISPSPIAGGGVWSDIIAGNNMACGVKIDGSGWCWGTDTNGSLGNGATITAVQHEPFPLAEPGPWKRIWPSSSVACAIKMDGTLWCWGSDSGGRLGNGAAITADQHSPVPVLGAGPWVEVTNPNGAGAPCAKKTDGSVWCWGSDANGKLGNGPVLTADQSSPSPVLLSGGNFTAADAMPGSFAAQPGANMAIGSTKISNTEGGAPGMTFPGSGLTLLQQNTGGSQFLFESDYTAGAAQFGFTANAQSYFMGMDISQGNLKFGPSTGGWLGNTSALDVSNAGFVGVGTHGAPVAKLDVRGGVRISDAGNTCGSTRAGTMKYADTEISYCNGTEWVVIGRPPAEEDSGPAAIDPAKRIVFQTSALYTGNLGGTAGAHQKCQSAADAANLPGVFKAWIVTDSTDPAVETFSPAVDFEQATVPYMMVNGTKLADNWADLTDGSIDNNFNVSETGATLSGGGANRSWTNATSSGASYNVSLDCSNWTSTSGNGRRGGNDQTSSSWTSTTDATCSTTARLYCFQHPYDESDSGIDALWDTVYLAFDNYGDHGCSPKSNASLWCWGDSAEGELGTNLSAVDVSSPVRVHSDTYSSPWYDWIQVSSNWSHTCGIRANGEAYCWGSEGSGRLGNNVTTATFKGRPVKVHDSSSATGWNDWRQISAGTEHTCGIRANGEAYCWGRSAAGRLGNNVTSDNTYGRPVKIHDTSSSTGWNDWVQISAGTESTCGLRANGEAYCWGDGSHQRLGINDSFFFNRGRPQKVHDSSSSTGWDDWVQISSGMNHNCGLRKNGEAYCWGEQEFGRLGNNLYNSDDVGRPRKVDDSSSSTGWNDWIQISAGQRHTCGIRASGQAWCWGRNDYGQLGNNSTTNAGRPVKVHDSASATGWNDWIYIDTSTESTCGVRANGTLWCWGWQDQGRFGNGVTSGNALRPVQVVP